MNKAYDKITAEHYAAFRPALHELILAKCIDKNASFSLGLDIGCGTGQSTKALSKYCHKVIGLDPSKEMIDRSIPTLGIEYIYFQETNLPFDKDSFDIITFAGSLYYAKSQILLDEVIRVSKIGAKIIAYDFNISLETILFQLGIQKFDEEKIAEVKRYNHQEDFSGLNQEGITKTKQQKEQLYLKLTSSELAHLILSKKGNYQNLGAQYGFKNLFEKISNRLDELSEASIMDIKTDIYYSVSQTNS